MLRKTILALTAALSFSLVGFANVSPLRGGLVRAPRAEVTLPGLAGKWVLVIRHGEKPAEGTGLTPAGEARAKAYVKYFMPYKLGATSIPLSVLVATKDSKKSYRERLTLEPLAKATGLKLQMDFKNAEYAELASSLGAKPQPGNVLICWHHGNIPKLVTALGGDSASLFPSGKWPDDHFDYVIELHYDASGHVIPADTKKVKEPTFPGTSTN